MCSHFIMKFFFVYGFVYSLYIQISPLHSPSSPPIPLQTYPPTTPSLRWNILGYQPTRAHLGTVGRSTWSPNDAQSGSPVKGRHQNQRGPTWRQRHTSCVMGLSPVHACPLVGGSVSVTLHGPTLVYYLLVVYFLFVHWVLSPTRPQDASSTAW